LFLTTNRTNHTNAQIVSPIRAIRDIRGQTPNDTISSKG